MTLRELTDAQRFRLLSNPVVALAVYQALLRSSRN